MLPAWLAAGALAWVAFGSGVAWAIPQDYRFDLVGNPIQAGGIGKMHQGDSRSIVWVRLTRLADDSAVPDAVLTVTQADVAPSGRPDVTALVWVLPPYHGLYRFEVHPLISEQWALQLAARLPACPVEPEPVRGDLVVSLVK